MLQLFTRKKGFYPAPAYGARVHQESLPQNKSCGRIHSAPFFRKSGAGFTLIELLVVIAVIGMLASIVLVSMTGVRKKARDAKGQTDIRQIMEAFEIKYSDNESYPDLPDGRTDIPSGDTRLSPYLNPTPYTNGVRTYQWYDGGSNQKFCVVFQYEAKSGYFTCSYRGCQDNSGGSCPNF